MNIGDKYIIVGFHAESDTFSVMREEYTGCDAVTAEDVCTLSAKDAQQLLDALSEAIADAPMFRALQALRKEDKAPQANKPN
jgi:hypothetical protein